MEAWRKEKWRNEEIKRWKKRVKERRREDEIERSRSREKATLRDKG